VKQCRANGLPVDISSRKHTRIVAEKSWSRPVPRSRNSLAQKEYHNPQYIGCSKMGN
jgi:hypothetical protein